MAASCDKLSRLLSQFRGSLVGSVVGDCLGAPFECCAQVALNELLDFFSKVGSVKHLYHFTDDTAMTRSVAESLVQQGLNAKEPQRFDAVSMAKRFVTEFRREPDRGYGRNVGAVFDGLEDNKFEDPFQPAREQFDGRGSYGNGGAMRISPAALYMCHQDASRTDDLVRSITQLTHSNVDAINGAILQCAAVQTALTIEPDSQLLARSLKENQSSDAASQFANDFIRVLQDRLSTVKSKEHLNPSNKQSPDNGASDDRNQQQIKSTYCDKLDIIRDFLGRANVDRSEVQHKLGTDISALGSVPAAIYSFLRCIRPVDDIPLEYSRFERTIIYAISLGGDTDTIASMAGAVAGAYYGESGIRRQWLDKCEGVEDARVYASELYKLLEDTQSSSL